MNFNENLARIILLNNVALKIYFFGFKMNDLNDHNNDVHVASNTHKK